MTASDTPTPLGDPLEPMSDADIIRYARGVITDEYMLADADDPDWHSSLMLILSGMMKALPPNASTMFLVPLGPHMHGHWINGRAPGVTMSAVCVPVESVAPLLAKCDEFWKAINPEVTQ